MMFWRCKIQVYLFMAILKINKKVTVYVGSGYGTSEV